MRDIRCLRVLILVLICLFSPLSAEDESAGTDTLLERLELAFPDEIWTETCENIDYTDRPIGYLDYEMARFSGDEYRLRTVENLFRDVRTLPRFTGYRALLLRKYRANFAAIASIGYTLLDCRAAKGVNPPTSETWGIKEIPDDATVDDALQYFLPESLEQDNEFDGLWHSYPAPIQKFVVRVLVATESALPAIYNAFDRRFIEDIMGVEDVNELSQEERYLLASGLWQDQVVDIAGMNRSYQMLEHVDLNYLNFGTLIYYEYLASAWQELRDTLELADEEYPTLTINTKLGKVLINGAEEEVELYDSSYIFVLDLGTNTHYSGDIAAPASFDYPIVTVIDLGGDDIYGSEDVSVSVGCGLFGIGTILDLKGDDHYICGESGIGNAWFGTGLVQDYEGDDCYLAKSASAEGAAYAGVGALIDLQGDDEYRYYQCAQGFGYTLGVGILIDGAGDDSYLPTEEMHELVATPEGKRKPPPSIAQGCGLGRRADYTDGHSLAGGIGILVECSGDDVYEGFGRYVQGSGYWWGLGILEDFGGDDTYSGYWYGQGASAHFAIGSMVDLKGNDTYNHNSFARAQFLGNGRDGSIAMFIDGAGDDNYWVHSRSGGEGDLNGIGIFWDRYGDDIYTLKRTYNVKAMPVLGAATTYDRYNSFRDEMASIGLFFDTQGDDTYDGTDYVDDRIEGRSLQAENDKEWLYWDGPINWGYGLDTDFDFDD